ncbi:MAG TPA: Minf_1886 family protein [Pirellulales bacterium]|nr:Minf_1886 family protein [Pirellulales bacterium]
MSETAQKIAELVRQDRRYRFEAYAFVFEALGYAHKVLGLGATKKSESATRKRAKSAGGEEEPENHLTGQQLCEAIRLYALEQYGYMAKCVLNNWGVHATGDFGEIVFNLIRIGEMRKTKDDRREDFNDVYDFETALRQEFRIEQAK